MPTFAVTVEARLGNRRFADNQAAVADVVIESALDPAGKRLENDAVPMLRLNVEPDVEVRNVPEIGHCDVSEHNLSISGGRAVGDESAAVFLKARLGLRILRFVEFRRVDTVALASRPDSRKPTSTSEFSVTMSSRSSRRPSNFAPAAAAPSAIPFISSRCSAS